MKTPHYLKEIAHIFADPLLQNTGLEGGYLENALSLMQEFIEKLFYEKFPGQKTNLQKIHQKIERCKYYLKLIKQNPPQALTTLADDIRKLGDSDWLIIPGGWNGRTKPGHAMLYLLMPKELIIINTGSGSLYHTKEPTPNIMKGHFLSIALNNKQDLITSGVLEGLLTLQTHPADYYSAELLYEVIIPVLPNGKVKTDYDPTHAYDLQLSGTCFWQCVEKLLFYFYRQNPDIFRLFRQHWKKALLEKIYRELQNFINGNDQLSGPDLQSAPWETYFRLIIFALRSYSSNILQTSPTEQQKFYFVLEQLRQFAELNLAKAHKLSFTYQPLGSNQLGKLDSQMATYDEYSHGQNISIYLPHPNLSYSTQDEFIRALYSTVDHIQHIDWQNRAQLINAHYIAELFLLYLPLSENFILSEIDHIISSLHQLISYYYRLQNTLFPKPSPEAYAKQLICGFAGFCFADKLIRQQTSLSYVNNYVPALNHFINKNSLLTIAPHLIITSPQLSLQLQKIILYLQPLEKLKIIFDFSNWKLTIEENCELPDADLLKESATFNLFNRYLTDKPLTQRIAYAIIDAQKQFFSASLHHWREIGLYCRLLISSFTAKENILSDKRWQLSLLQAQKNTSVCLNLSGFQSLNPVAWEAYSTQAVSDPAIRWLCDTPQSSLDENTILTQAMPESKIITRRLFNQLAEIHVSPNLQVFSILEFMIQHVHQFQHEDLRQLFDKYLFSAGDKITDEGSLLFKETHNHPELKQLLLKFMNIAEYYFSGKSQHIPTYLSLIRCFLAIERFLSEPVCFVIYEKLYNFLLYQNKYRGEIAAHLILLYQNISNPDTVVIERLLTCWAHLLREKILQENFPEFLFLDTKKVLLTLQYNIDLLLDDETIRDQILNIFFQTLFSLSTPINRKWQKIGTAGFQSDNYFINLFDGKIYYNGFPLGRLPDEITQNTDYIKLFGQRTLAIELLQSNSDVSVYRTMGEPTRLLTLYRYLPNTQNNDQRPYGKFFYSQLVYCANIHSSYFSLADFDITLDSPNSRTAKRNNLTKPSCDVIIHEELTINNERIWAQFLPRWRLEGHLPSALLDNYIYFISVTNNQIIYTLDQHRQPQDLTNWLDLLRLPLNHPLIAFCEVLFQFELPNFILAFSEHNGFITIELTRHQLKFRYNPETKLLQSLNYNNYYLTTGEPHHLTNVSYQLILQNSYGELIIIFPYFITLKQGFLADDPLNGKIYSDLRELGSPGYFGYRYAADFEQLEAETLQAELYLTHLYAKTRDYLRTFYHLQYCWQDQLLSPNEWVLFNKFFTETAEDLHPDMHACRLHAILLYLPIYTLLYERQTAKDILDSNEKTQLAGFQAIFKLLIKDYENYLSKWPYIHHSLRLNQEQEQLLLDTIKQWEFPKSRQLVNREDAIQQSSHAQLSTPKYTYQDKTNPVFTYNSLPSFFSLGNTPVDLFGYAQENPVSISECFLFLYAEYTQKKRSAAQLLLTLRSLVWSGKADSSLCRYLRQLTSLNPDKLPSLLMLPNEKKLIYISLNDLKLNFTEEAKILCAWFEKLKVFLDSQVTSITSPSTTNIFITLAQQKTVTVDCHKAMPNTLPNNPVSRDPKKMAITFNTQKFTQEYGFDPQQPLGHIFKRYFTRKQEKPIVRSFPLEKSTGELANYMVEYFRTDFDYFQSLPQDVFSANTNIASLENELKLFLSSLYQKQQALKLQLLALANKNPCKSDEPISAQDEFKIMGLHIHYAKLAGMKNSFTLSYLLTCLIEQQRENYLEQNPFLTPDNVNTLITQTIEYLLLSNAISLIKRIMALLNNAKEEKNILSQIGKLCYQQRYYSIEQKPLYLVLEYLMGSLLWELQVQKLEELRPVFKEQVVQLFLGGGKSSTVAPLLGYSLADGKQLMTYTIPAALVAQFVQVLRQRLRGPLFKRVHTFHLQRNSLLTPTIINNYLQKFRGIKKNKDVLVTTPDIPNCLLLKWLELSKDIYHGQRQHRDTVVVLENILCFLGLSGTQLIDELDSVLAPLKSELNFTEGEAQRLTPAPSRWIFAQQLLLVILQHPDLQVVIQQGISQHHCKTQGTMLELINMDFYHLSLKPAIAKLFLDSQKQNNAIIQEFLPIFLGYLLTDPGVLSGQEIILPPDLIQALEKSTIYTYAQKQKLSELRLLLSMNPMLSKKLYSRSIHPLLATLMSAHVAYLREKDENLSDYFIMTKEWLQAILPHILQKRLNIHYGRYFEISRKKYSPDKKLAVPYHGKDSPSKRAEFQHPDIIIAFTCLMYFYEGLQYDEFVELITHLQAEMEKQTAKELQERDAVVLFRQWQTDATLNPIELNQIDLTEPWQLTTLYQALYQQPTIICYYLNNFIFLHYLKIFPLKLSSNSFDLAAMVFHVTKGISGTIHNHLCLPENLTAHYQKGTDGSMLYILSMTLNQQVLVVDFKNDVELLEKVDFQHFKMFIDTGGLIQGTSNIDVANILLSRAPDKILGVIFVDDVSQQLRVLTREGLNQSASECSIPPQYLFKYIDHAHTTGTDMMQYINDRGLMTLSPQTTLRDVFQGAKRLRLLDIQGNQSLVCLLRDTDAKQINTTTSLTSRHILQWSFGHSLQQIGEELHVATYQRLHAVIRRRAYHLLLGKCSFSKMPRSLDEQVREQLWQNLHDCHILDEYDRVRHEVKKSGLQEIGYLKEDIKQELIQILNTLYRYRQKQDGIDTIALCFAAFSDRVDYRLTQLLPLDTCEHTADLLTHYKSSLLDQFGGILTAEDQLILQSIVDQAKQFLPEWTVTKPFNQQVERERQQLGEKQNENQQQQEQQQERQNQQSTLYKPVPEISWSYKQLIEKNITQLTILPEKLKSPSQELRILKLSSILSLPFSPQLFASENFLRTEINSYTLKNFAKNILFYLEFQEDQRYFILIDAKEAGNIRYCLEKNYLSGKGFGLRTLAGTLLNASDKFIVADIPEILAVQLYFLNGAVENEIPSQLHITWQSWISQTDPAQLNNYQQQLRIALAL